MSQWMTITVSCDTVKLENGSLWARGESIRLGLGRLQLKWTPRAGLHVVRYSGSGNYRYHIKLRQDGEYRLGAHRGHRVVPATEESNPMKRILRLMGIPVTVLQHTTDPTLEVGRRWYDNSHCPVGRNTSRWIHDGAVSILDSKDYEKPHGHFGGGGYDTLKITGATYAIRVDEGRSMNGSAWSRPGLIVVWETCTPTKLANALAPIVWGPGADEEYISALQSAGDAQRWIEKRFAVAAHPTKGNQVVVHDRDFKYDFILGVSWMQSPRVLDRLIDTHGISLIERSLGDLQRDFLRAKENVAEAVRYVLANYRVVAVESGEKRHLKFALNATPERLGSTDSVYLNQQEETPLQALLEQHKTLKELLCTLSPERRQSTGD